MVKFPMGGRLGDSPVDGRLAKDRLDTALVDPAPLVLGFSLVCGTGRGRSAVGSLHSWYTCVTPRSIGAVVLEPWCGGCGAGAALGAEVPMLACGSAWDAAAEATPGNPFVVEYPKPERLWLKPSMEAVETSGWKAVGGGGSSCL
eukprot:gene1665-biopygen1426